MKRTKRVADLIFTLTLLIPLLPILLITGLAIYAIDGRPIFYVSDRSRAPGRIFRLVKFRSMRSEENDTGASGGHKTNRITLTGAFLRNSRVDEIPQLWNILKGDMSFVGPRPPLPIYVEKFPEVYTEVLKCRPGVTGLATIYFHEREERLLRYCQTKEENERVYQEKCIPRKAHFDLIYLKNQSLCFDVWIMLATVFKSLR